MSRGVRFGEDIWLHEVESIPYCEFNRAILFCVVVWSTPAVSVKSGTGGRLGDCWDGPEVGVWMAYRLMLPVELNRGED